jgi:hypothetical protein
MDLFISKSEWIAWKSNPVTKVFLKAIFDKRESIKEELAEGRGREDLNLYIGQCQGMKDCLDYAINSFEYIEDEIQQ